MDPLSDEVSELQLSGSGFAEECLKIMDMAPDSEDENYYSVPNLRQLRSVRLKDQSELVADEGADDVPPVPSNSSSTPEEQSELRNYCYSFQERQVPPEFHGYKFGNRLVFTEHQKEYLRENAKLFKELAAWNQERFEQTAGEDAASSPLNPANRKSMRFWSNTPSP